MAIISFKASPTRFKLTDSSRRQTSPGKVPSMLGDLTIKTVHLVQHGKIEQAASLVTEFKKIETLDQGVRRLLTGLGRYLTSTISLGLLNEKEKAKAANDVGRILAGVALANQKSAIAKDAKGDHQERDPLFADNVSFAPQNSAEGKILVAQLSEKGFALGKGPIVLNLKSSIDMEPVKRAFTAKLFGTSLVLEHQQLLGVTPAYAKKQGYDKPVDCVNEMATVVMGKARQKFTLMEGASSWNRAAWALMISQADVNILSRASGGRFQYHHWGLAFKTN